MLINFIDIAHAASEAAAEVVPQTGLLGTLGINSTLFIFQLINFIVVALILWFLILKPLTKKMAERQQIIDESLDNAKKVGENLEKSEQEYQKKLKAARIEAEKVIEKASLEADKTGAELRAKAKQDIEKLVAQAKANIKIEKEEMMAGLKAETANLIVLALEKILDEKVTAEKDKKFVKEVLEKLQ